MKKQTIIDYCYYFFALIISVWLATHPFGKLVKDRDTLEISIDYGLQILASLITTSGIISLPILST